MLDNHSLYPAPFRWLALTILFGLAGGLTGCRKVPAGETATSPAKVQVIAVTKVTRMNLARELAFDGEFRPFQDLDLHAKVAGFVRTMNVDVGDAVQPGQLLATLEVPELKEDLARAAAAVKRAQQDVVKAEEDAHRAEEEIRRADAEIIRARTAYAEAKLHAGRIAGVAKEQAGLVAQQEIDAALAKERTAEAQVAAAQAAHAGTRAAAAAARAAIAATREQVHVAEAERQKLDARAAFTQITAPFAGIITRRYADAGDMVRGGLSPSAPAVPLVRLVYQARLRLLFPVSASHVTRVRPGQVVEVAVAQLNRKFPGTVARVSGELDAATRTLEAQVDVANADGSLLPGLFGTVTLRLDQREGVLAVPVTAIGRAGAPDVLVVTADQTLEKRPVKIGLETAARVEITSGLSEGELVFVGARSQVRVGQKVEPKTVESLVAE